jgi:hypothetical protein
MATKINTPRTRLRTSGNIWLDQLDRDMRLANAWLEQMQAILRQCNLQGTILLLSHGYNSWTVVYHPDRIHRDLWLYNIEFSKHRILLDLKSLQGLPPPSVEFIQGVL